MPNAELVGNAFTNWTRPDAVVRTVFVVGAGYRVDLQASGIPSRNGTYLSESLRRAPRPRSLRRPPRGPDGPLSIRVIPYESG